MEKQRRSIILAKQSDNQNHVDEINAYYAAVNQQLLAFVEHIKSLSDANIASKLNCRLQAVTDKEALAIKSLIGIDVSGYTHSINGSSVTHIEKRHGVNGAHDNSMAFAEDVARVEFILKNYDSVNALLTEDFRRFPRVWKNSDGTPSQMIKYEKQLNGTYYVVEAIPDTKRKALQIVSVYIKQ